jgi:hypothetical protein
MEYDVIALRFQAKLKENQNSQRASHDTFYNPIRLRLTFPQKNMINF